MNTLYYNPSVFYQWRYQTWKNSKVEISIYQYLNIYLPSFCRERRPLLAHFERTNYKTSITVWANMTTYLGVVR